MRTEKELLILLRNELPGRIIEAGGMCIAISFLRIDGLISFDEGLLLESYLNKNDPDIRYFTSGYWWEDGELEPRINWLNEQIEKL